MREQIEFPMCWKCHYSIMEKRTGTSGRIYRTMVGCETSDKITNYNEAAERCPLLKRYEETRKQREKRIVQGILYRDTGAGDGRSG